MNTKMEKMAFGILATVMLGLLFTPLVTAIPDGALANNVASSSNAINTDPGGTHAVTAGWVYHVDVSGTTYTNYWAGVWGNVSGSVEMRDGGGNIFLTKSVGTSPANDAVDGIRTMVFAYDLADSVPDFGNLNAVLRSGNGIDTQTNVNTALTDSATNVFTFNSFPNLVIGNKTINNNQANTAWCARSYNHTLSVSGGKNGQLNNNDCMFTTISLNDGSNNLLFATEAINPYAGDTRAIFDNVTFAHYQMLLYVNNSGGAIANNYEFFLELR